jgi:hypothetical protein
MSGAEAASAPGMSPDPEAAPSGSLLERALALFLATANRESTRLIFAPPHFGHRAFRLGAPAVRTRKLKTRLQSWHRNSYTGID